MMCSVQPVVCMVICSWCCLLFVPRGLCRKVLSLLVAMSSPKMMENADTMSAFSCSPVSFEVLDMRSSAYALSLLGVSVSSDLRM